MEALEALTDRLATGDLGIEQAADLYEQAEAIHARAAAGWRRFRSASPGSAADRDCSAARRAPDPDLFS